MGERYTEYIGLLRAVFYHVGKVCCLRGGEEQCKLKRSQFTRTSNPDMYKLCGKRMKNEIKTE